MLDTDPNDDAQMAELTALLGYTSFLRLVHRNPRLWAVLRPCVDRVASGDDEHDTAVVNDAFIAAWRRHGGRDTAR